MIPAVFRMEYPNLKPHSRELAFKSRGVDAFHLFWLHFAPCEFGAIRQPQLHVPLPWCEKRSRSWILYHQMVFFFGEGLDRLESLSLTALALIALMQLPISFNFTVLECLVWFCRFFVFSFLYFRCGMILVVSQSKLLLASSQRLAASNSQFSARLRPQCQASPNAACASLVPANSGSNANKWCSWCS